MGIQIVIPPFLEGVESRVKPPGPTSVSGDAADGHVGAFVIVRPEPIRGKVLHLIN